jgi:hypothetical protein
MALLLEYLFLYEKSDITCSKVFIIFYFIFCLKTKFILELNINLGRTSQIKNVNHQK